MEKVTLVPEKGLSVFFLEEKIDKYLDSYDHIYEEAEDDEEWDAYLFWDEQIEVYVNKNTGEIENVGSRVSCFYEDQQLIGMDFNEFLQLLKIDQSELEAEKVWISDTEEQTAYDINDRLMQVWVDENNQIRTIFVL